MFAHIHILRLFQTLKNKKLKLKKLGFIITLQLKRRETPHRLALQIKKPTGLHLRWCSLSYITIWKNYNRFSYKLNWNFLSDVDVSYFEVTPYLFILSLLLFCYLFYFTNILFLTYIYTYTFISLSIMCVWNCLIKSFSWSKYNNSHTTCLAAVNSEYHVQYY